MGQSTSSDQRQSILNDLRIPPVCLFVSVFVCLCIYLSVCLLACLPACLSVCLQRTSTKTTKNTLIHNSRAYVIDKNKKKKNTINMYIEKSSRPRHVCGRIVYAGGPFMRHRTPTSTGSPRGESGRAAACLATSSRGQACNSPKSSSRPPNHSPLRYARKGVAPLSPYPAPIHS